MDFLSNLNPVQKQAVEHPGGPVLIVAGAGSGKTRVLTHRIAYLIHKRVPPPEILAVTFTNKAAQEMKQRVLQLVHQELFWIGTFHSICVKILRRHASEIGYLSTFSIYDDQDQASVVKTCLKELNIDPKDFKPASVINAISRAKDSLIEPKTYEEQASGYYDEIISKIYTLYEKKLNQCQAFDFGDLIMKTVILFREKPEILDIYREKFKHVLVDEYQDTNHAQYQLVKYLSGKHKNIYVVGDPDQSIYRWRGADIKNILYFERDFEETKVVNMEQNYRSTKNILEASNHLIRHNADRKEKNLWTEREAGEKITYYQGEDEQSEAQFLVQTAGHLVQESGRSLSDIVVFYRTHAQSRVLENALRRGRVPYKIFGGISFYSRKEIKDVLAYLKISIDPSDDVNLKRIINIPARGIGKSTVDLLEKRAAQMGCSIYQVIKSSLEDPSFMHRSKKALYGFMTLVETIRAKSLGLTITQLLVEVLRSTGYVEMLESTDDVESEERLENVRELISATEEFEEEESEPTLPNFLEQMALRSHVDTYHENDDNLTLMTLHCAKGLEFPVAFIVGFEEELFPHAISSFEPEELEEERRLCYVGMTRAKDKLYLSGVNMRRLFGETTPKSPSRFLSEIPEEYIDFISRRRITRWDPDVDENQWIEKEAQEAEEEKRPLFDEGDRVVHPEFGVGRVQEVIGRSNGVKYSVLFEGNFEPKLLLGKYARLTKY